MSSDAIEAADCMVYGVSLAYKESANCRLEANVSALLLRVNPPTFLTYCLLASTHTSKSWT